MSSFSYMLVCNRGVQKCKVQVFKKHNAFSAVIMYTHHKNIRVCQFAAGKSKPWAYFDTKILRDFCEKRALGEKAI